MSARAPQMMVGALSEDSWSILVRSRRVTMPATGPGAGSPGAVPARTGTSNYAATPDGAAMNAGMLFAAGGTQPFSNLEPYLALNFCIAMQGTFPSRN